MPPQLRCATSFMVIQKIHQAWTPLIDSTRPAQVSPCSFVGIQLANQRRPLASTASSVSYPSLSCLNLHTNRALRVRSYENPFVTATSRSVIADIYALSRQISHVDVPRPLAMLCTLFRIKPPDPVYGKIETPLFQAMRIWTDVGEVSESESFGENSPLRMGELSLK